jgi:hypothetical protein
MKSESTVQVPAVRRNLERFPTDFMFQLSGPEWSSLRELIENQYHSSLRSQIVILEKNGPGQHTKYLPFVFTEQGVAMLSSVLKSPGAVSVNIQIMRIFVRMRQMITNYFLGKAKARVICLRSAESIRHQIVEPFMHVFNVF